MTRAPQLPTRKSRFRRSNLERRIRFRFRLRAPVSRLGGTRRNEESTMTTIPEQQEAGVGLTTTKAPFIERAQQEGRLYIHQPYELYSEANHDAWRRLFARMESRWRRYANPRFLQGIDSLCLDAERVPRVEDVNRFLSPLTGFKAKPVSGYIPSFLFFNSLRNREFPTTITIRDGATLDYLPEPDIFHDIAGHVPM